MRLAQRSDRADAHHRSRHTTASTAVYLGCFWRFVEKQLSLARKVYAVYEAGAFGFWPARQLQGFGTECYVVHPEKLDPRHKRVQTDKLDSRHLADKLQRYVLGNSLTAVDVYSATFMALFGPLPPGQCQMDAGTRAAFETRDAPTAAALDPILFEHRDMMYAVHLALPLSL